MSEIAAGFWPCKVINGFYGDNDKDIPIVRINVEITEGANKGSRHTYEEQVNNRQAPYIARSCKAVGWKCQSLSTLSADVESWIKETGGLSTVEIKHIERKNGPKAGTIWAKANSIGRGPRPLKESSKENLSDADEMMRAALADDNSGNDSNRSGGPPHDDVPPPIDDDIPFITCSMAADLAPRISKAMKVLRW